MQSLAHIPGSGSLLELPRMLRDPTRFLEERYFRHGPVFRSRFVFPLVFFVGAEANRQILITRRDQLSHKEGYALSAFGRIFENSLVSEDGEAHAHDRDILQPAVGRLALAECLDDVQRIWDRAADSLQQRPVRDVYELVRDTTFEVAAVALMDLRPGDDLTRWRGLFEQLIDGTMGALPLRIPFGKVDRGLRAREALIRQLAPRIAEARSSGARGLLGALAQHRDPSGEPLTDRRIAEHVLLLLWAGYDTTAAAGSWALWELARLPQWQARLRKEPASIDLVLKEIERLRPAAIFFPRRAVAEVELAGHRVPRGTLVFYTPYMSHRIPELFPEPEKFDPERWERGAPSSALVGFGGGPRICLGKAFALLQLRVMLATLLGRFELREARAGRVVAVPTYRLSGASLEFTPRSA
jgi:cytochrome P450